MVAFTQIVLRISAFGSGALGLWLFFATNELGMPKESWKAYFDMSPMGLLGDFYSGLNIRPDVGMR